MKGLSNKNLADFQKNFSQDGRNQLAANNAVRNGVLESSTNYARTRELPFTFSIDLKQGKITNQKASGRCWIFAATNVLRYEMIQKFKLETFELSQNYLFFYDKLEKANYYLESVLKTVDEPIDGRLFSFINANPLQDGGQWDMVANLIRKYGVVPKEAYPDAASATSSRFFDQYLTTRLREGAMQLRELATQGAKSMVLQKKKIAVMDDIYRMLCISLGQPPKTFDFTMRNKDNKVTQDFGITPQEFFKKYIGLNLDDYVGLIHSPQKSKPYNQLYTVKFLGNVAEGKDIVYLNLPMEKIKKAAISQLKDGHPVWFGSDCSKFGLRNEGVFDRKATDVENLFQVTYHFDKAQALDYGDSAMNHAMVLLGVNLNQDKKPDRWRIENSWGKDAGGHDGYYVASDEWFDDYVYQVVVNKKYLDKATKELLKGEVTALEPWDPFGSLAD
ncbi:MAG: C1 family peptidase [Lachnospiraceae bacterium]|nr:C1 family peptidase [Lachnospiraceae bacterium]